MDYQAYQHEFANRLRNPAQASSPANIDSERMQVYEELIFNNFNSFLLACYPVTYKILGDRAWQALAKQGFAEIRSDTPLFREIPAIFLAWLQPKAIELFPQYPWLWEFMHYEWIELRVQTDEADLDKRSNTSSKPAKPLKQSLQLNPTAQLACYQWPVHTIAPDNLNIKISDQSYCFLIFRNNLDETHFIELNPLMAQLVQQLQASPEDTLEQIIHALATTIEWNPDQDLSQFVLPVLDSLQQQEVILGWNK